MSAADVSRVIQVACDRCGLDIENDWPFRSNYWRDRGNDTHCPGRQQWHRPPAAIARLAFARKRRRRRTVRRLSLRQLAIRIRAAAARKANAPYKRLQHAQAMHRKAVTRVRRAQTIERQWRRRMQAMTRRLRTAAATVAACPPAVDIDDTNGGDS